MRRPFQDFCVFARENSWIRLAGAEKHNSEPVRWKTAYDFFYGKILRVRVGFVRE